MFTILMFTYEKMFFFKYNLEFLKFYKLLFESFMVAYMCCWKVIFTCGTDLGVLGIVGEGGGYVHKFYSRMDFVAVWKHKVYYYN